MSEIYEGRKNKKSTPPPQTLPSVAALLLKQTIAVIICIAVVWAMKTLPLPKLNLWAEALKSAASYHMDLDYFKEVWNKLPFIGSPAPPEPESGEIITEH